MTPAEKTSPVRLSRFAALISISLFAIALGGCNKQQKQAELTIAELQSDNQSLREENERISGDLRTAQDRAGTLEAENATLKAAPGGGGSGFHGDRVLSIAGDVAFGAGQTTLTAAGKREVDKMIDVIKGQYSGNRIEVAGFTDSDPLKKTKDKYADNENLSVQRALSVERYLNSRGIPADLTHSAGYGPAFAKGSKKDSRRVEIRILEN